MSPAFLTHFKLRSFVVMTLPTAVSDLSPVATPFMQVSVHYLEELVPWDVCGLHIAGSASRDDVLGLSLSLVCCHAF